mmetsp:Transcript_66731/g.157487  ORF Transcript_66731/g.157487 Transcript_66731/m.157487 type:complete len:209 (-) Transcript_66731:41-667(-)
MGPRAFPKRGTFTIMPGLRVQAITRGLAAAGAKPQDIIFISDVDEIPHPATVAWSHTHDFNAPDQRLWAIQLRVMYYYLNTMHPAQFIPSCRVFPYSYIAEGGTIAAIRSISYRKINHKRNPPGWHFSYLGDGNKMREKIAAYAHSEWDDDHWNDPNRLDEVRDKLVDPFGRTQFSEGWSILPVETYMPQYVIEHKEEYIARGLIREQ